MKPSPIIGFQFTNGQVAPVSAPSTAARYTRRAVALIALTLAIVLFMGAGDTVDQRFNDLGHKLMCKCGCNEVLLECNHVGCTVSDHMRKELMAALQRGDNNSLILQTFVQEYGPTVLAAPPTTGFDFVAWIMPFVALAGGVLLLIVIVRAWKHRAPVPAVAAPAGLTPAALEGLRRRVHEETEL